MSDQARDDDRQQMSLAVHFHPTGHHVAAWLHPRSQIDAGSNPEKMSDAGISFVAIKSRQSLDRLGPALAGQAPRDRSIHNRFFRHSINFDAVAGA